MDPLSRAEIGRLTIHFSGLDEWLTAALPYLTQNSDSAGRKCGNLERHRARKRQATSTGGKKPQLQEIIPEAAGQARDAEYDRVARKPFSEKVSLLRSQINRIAVEFHLEGTSEVLQLLTHCDEMLEVAATRNDIIHGYFQPDPFTGEAAFFNARWKRVRKAGGAEIAELANKAGWLMFSGAAKLVALASLAESKPAPQ